MLPLWLVALRGVRSCVDLNGVVAAFLIRKEHEAKPDRGNLGGIDLIDNHTPTLVHPATVDRHGVRLFGCQGGRRAGGPCAGPPSSDRGDF